MAHKKFGQKSTDAPAEAPEPITFDLATVEGINCRQKVNGKLLMELVAKVDSGHVGQQAEGILQVFEVCVRTDDGDEPEEYTGKREQRHTVAEAQAAEEDELILGVDPTSSLGRLTTFLDDPNTEIEIEELAELVGWLVEQYTGRPTKNAANSRGGGRSTKDTSRRARRSQERTIAKEARRSSTTSSTDASLTSV